MPKTTVFVVMSKLAQTFTIIRQELSGVPDRKPRHTFKPLYGGVSGTEDQKRYYRAFKQKYNGVTDWHELYSEMP